ncbi:hypothetical protein BRD13_08350 [Halobacteriales archaeon SW_5_70_135]|nr:MAG: hypothetical protein BRD13_08350 [Halobacteriales archaeon SW_5_70_135]
MDAPRSGTGAPLRLGARGRPRRPRPRAGLGRPGCRRRTPLPARRRPRERRPGAARRLRRADRRGDAAPRARRPGAGRGLRLQRPRPLPVGRRRSRERCSFESTGIAKRFR